MYATATNIKIFLTSLSKRSFQTDKTNNKAERDLVCIEGVNSLWVAKSI